MRLIDDAERRARLGRRHALAPQHRVADALAAIRAMTVLHATEPATPYLSLFARIDSCTRADLDDALFASRSLVKQLAMRRTLFVFPRELLPAAVSGPSARVKESIRANSDRYGVAGSVACSTVIARVAASASATRCCGASACRLASRALRSASSISRMPLQGFRRSLSISC